MITNYNHRELMRAYNRHFWRENKDYRYWLLVALTSHFYKPYRKKQVVSAKKVEEYFYKNLYRYSTDDDFSCNDEAGVDCYVHENFRDFLRVLKFLSENNYEWMENYIFVSEEHDIFTFEKIHIPEQGGERQFEGKFFEIKLTIEQDYYESGEYEIDYRASFSYEGENGENVVSNVLVSNKKNMTLI